MNAVLRALTMAQSLSEHVAVFELPEPVTVTIANTRLLVQVWNDDRAVLAAALLAWADTMTELDCSAWYPAVYDEAHIDIAGQLSDGIPITVFGRVPGDPAELFGTAPEPSDRRPIPLGLLREFADIRGGEAA